MVILVVVKSSDSTMVVRLSIGRQRQMIIRDRIRGGAGGVNRLAR